MICDMHGDGFSIWHLVNAATFEEISHETAVSKGTVAHPATVFCEYELPY